MRFMLEKYLSIPRDGEGGGGGAADPGGANPPAAGPSGGGDPAQPGGGNPPAGRGASDPSAAQPYRPDGLPDTMFGQNDRETIDKMHTALQGYRQRDSAVGPDADAYKAFDFDKLQVPAELKPHMEGLAEDPIMDAVAKYAFENRLPVPLAQGLVVTAYAEAMKAGVFEGYVDVKAERAALLPDNAKSLPEAQQEAAIEARLQANEDWVKLIAQSDKNPNGLPKDVADHVLLMLMDTAKGNQALEYFRHRMTGGGAAQPIAGSGGSAPGGLSAEGLRARQALPENTPGDPKFSQISYDALMADYRRLHGE